MPRDISEIKKRYSSILKSAASESGGAKLDKSIAELMKYANDYCKKDIASKDFKTVGMILADLKKIANERGKKKKSTKRLRIISASTTTIPAPSATQQYAPVTQTADSTKILQRRAEQSTYKVVDFNSFQRAVSSGKRNLGFNPDVTQDVIVKATVAEGTAHGLRSSGQLSIELQDLNGNGDSLRITLNADDLKRMGKNPEEVFSRLSSMSAKTHSDERKIELKGQWSGIKKRLSMSDITFG
jgi:hypothetical protein